MNCQYCGIDMDDMDKEHWSEYYCPNSPTGEHMNELEEARKKLKECEEERKILQQNKKLNMTTFREWLNTTTPKPHAYCIGDLFTYLTGNPYRVKGSERKVRIVVNGIEREMFNNNRSKQYLRWIFNEWIPFCRSEVEPNMEKLHIRSLYSGFMGLPLFLSLEDRA